MTGVSELDRWVELRDRLGRVLREEHGALADFLSESGDFFRRSATSFSIESDADGDGEGLAVNNITATACVLYLTLGTARDRSTPNDLEAMLRASIDLKLVRDWLEDRLVEVYRTGPRRRLESSAYTDIDDLPNPYNTSIQVCGLLVATRVLKLSPRTEMHRVLLAAATTIASWTEQAAAAAPASGGRRVRSGRENPAAGKPYLLYWCYAALLELTKYLTDRGIKSEVALAERLDSAAADLRDYSTAQLSSLIAAHHAGIEGATDATDFLFTLLVAALRSDAEHRSGSRDLIVHGAHVFLERHVSAEGSMYPRSTALVDRQRTPIVISTAEHCALLLEGAGNYLAEETEVLAALAGYLVGRRRGEQGWGHEALGSDEKRPVYVTAGALAFLQRFHGHLQSRIERVALEQLGLSAERPAPSIRSIQLDPTIAEILEMDVVGPILRGNRSEAAMSLVLHGPPGTAKTTCAEKLASMLEWPLVQLSPAVFLGRGSDHIDGEAERVFELLTLLEDKVILFDEFEEMIRSRDSGESKSRFLTTSMLPRLHHIRDKASIVFIVATNDLAVIDAAARRFGRIDRIVLLSYPSEAARRTMFENVKGRFFDAQDGHEEPRCFKLLADLGFPLAPVQTGSAAMRSAIQILKPIKTFDDFGYGHIREATRRLVARERAGRTLDYEDVATVIIEVSKHDIVEEAEF
ncbi:MAG: AAA family ATPase [Actinobacteria bacterium]|nr:AAA family ATPase [Actinomycetota bacterium]